MNRRFGVAAIILSLSVASVVAPLKAQAQVTLSSTASPAAGSPGLTTINVTGSNFPAGTISPSSVTVTLTPSGGGSATTSTPSAVTTILGTTRRVTFVIPSSISVSAATVFQVAVSGTTTTGTAFSSTNSASLTVNPSAGAVRLSNASLTFGSQLIGTTSSPQTITVNNSGTSSITITSITLTGTNPAEYKEINVNCPISPSTLAAGGTCTVQVSFQPLAAGTRTANVTFTDNAGGVPGSQQSVSLTGTATAAAPTVTTIPVTFSPGSNVSGVATLNCPSNTVPCTDSNAHSLKVVVNQVNTAFTLTVTTFEVSLSEANGVCESGKDETTDFDCRFKNNFSYQAQPNGDVIVPQCIPVSNGNCVYYRIGNVPPGSAYQGPVFETISWNDNAFVPPAFYQSDNPRLFDDPDSAPYDTNHQFVFDITDFFDSNGNHVGVDPTISGHTKQYNDFVVAFPSTLPNPAYTFSYVSPLAGGTSSFQQGTTAPISFTLKQGTTPITNALAIPNAVAFGLTNSSGVRQATLAPDGTAATFTYNATAQQYLLTLATQNLAPGTYTLFVNSNLFLQQSTTFTIAAAPLQITATSPLPAGSTGVFYSQTLAATGGIAPYTWAITGGTQPAGLSLSTAGVLSGTPSAAVASNFTVTITDSAAHTQSKSFALSISTSTGVPTSMSANAGTTPQSAAVNAAFANALAVTVRDTSNNPVSGVNVTFTAPSSGASGKFSNNTTTITVATNAAGIASAPFTANGTSGGPFTVTASATGLTAVSFSLTNTSGAASTMTANAGSTPQSATINTAFANALAVTVRDAANNPVSGVNVSFTAPASGASGKFSNSTTTITVATNASGIASAPITANATAGGPYTVTASATGLSTVNFSLTNTSGAPGTMTANAGSTPQSATINTAFANALSVTVRDGSNNPVAGINVSFAAPGTGASGLFSNSTTVITVATNAVGVASAPFTANGIAGGPYSVTATATGVAAGVTFSLTNNPGAATTMTANAGTTPQSATVNTAFANALAVTVKDATNNPVSGVNVTFTAPAAVPGATSGKFSNNTATITVATNASGVATAPLTANGTTGVYTVAATATGLPTVNFSLTNSPGAASTMTANAGTTPQSAMVSTTFANSLAVTVRDAANNPVPNVNVTFTAPSTGASGVFISNGSTTILVATGVTGIAVAPFRANATVGGPYTVTAAATGLTAVNFSLTNTSPTLNITSTSLPNGQVGLAYSTTLTATGGVPSYTWSISVGALPSGLNINAATGVISGTPLGSGTVNFTIKVTDSASNVQTANVSIKVAPSQLTVTTTSLPNGQIGVPYSATLGAAGGSSPYTWAITSGALPANVNLNASTGVISGTPTASGSFTVTFTVNDSSVPLQTQSASFTFNVTTGPTLTNVSPASVNQGDSNVNIGITGHFTNFLPGVSTVSFGTTDITVNSVTVSTSTSLNVNVSVAINAIVGARTVTVTTNSEVATGTGLFAIHAGVPTVTLNPTFGVEGTNPTITVTGTFSHFTQGLTTANFGSGDIAAGAVTVNSPTQATVQIQISIAASVGPRSISLVTGTEIATGSFNVTAGLPAIVIASPNLGGQSATVTVNLTGNFTSWVNGTTVASFGPGIKVGGGTAGAFGPVTVSGGTHLAATLTIDPSATLGPRDITVKTGTEQEIATGGFTVANCTTTAATVLLFEPSFNATGVPLNVQPRFEFNAPLDRTKFNSGNTYLYEGITGNTIPSTFNIDVTGRIVTITPSQLLGVGRQYYAYLGYGTGGAKDACANNINQYTLFTTSFSTQTLGPSVLQTSPRNGDTNVPENPQVVLQFSAPVDPISVESGFQVTTGTTPVPGTTKYSPDYTIMTFTPGTTLSSSTSYTVSYSNQILDQAGNALGNPGNFSFTTAAATDVTHGSVTSTNPQFSEVGVGTNIAPSFYLNKIVDPITVSTANVYLTNSNTGKLIAGSVSVSTDRRHVTFTPSQALQPGTYYYIYFSAGSNALDLAGNYFNSTYVYFTTAGSSITTGPTVTAVSPENSATGTPVNTQVAITLSGLIDPNSVGNSAITVTPQGSTTPVVGTVALAADQVTLKWTPSVSLAISKLYNVQVAGFRDTQGNLATPFSSTFTTGSSSTPYAAGTLTLVSASPVNGATGVSNNSPIVLTFSHGVNPATLNNISVYSASTSAQVAGTWASSSANPAVATFTPAGMYPANSPIYVFTGGHVQDFAGISDNIGTATTFTIGSTIDVIHPTVTSVTPTNGSTGIGRNTPVILTFSESVDPTTVNGNTIQLFVGNAPANFSPILSGNNRTVTLSATLPVNSTITVVATPFVKDLSGNTLTSFQSAFTTAADFSSTSPAVVTQRPGTGATDVPPNSVITLFTNGRPLVPSTVNANSLRVSQNGTILNGTIAVLGDNHAIEFTPSAAFNAGAIVQIFLANTIQDVDGNFLNAYQGQITIAGNSASVQPTVIARNPAYGASGIALNVIPKVAFDQAINPSTVNATNVAMYDGTLGAYLTGGTASLTGANNNVVQFKPATNLAANHLFYLYLNNLKNAAGLAISNSYYQYFTTGTAADATAPTVLAVSPVDSTTNIGTNAKIVVQFSKIMDPISITGSTIQVTGGSQTVVPVSVSLDTTTRFVTLTPQAPLPANTLMTLTITGATDPEGNLVTPKTTHFTTGPGPDITPAEVLFFSPQYNSANVPTNSSIVVQWNKQMNTATIFDQTGNGTYLYDSVTGLHVPGTLTFSSDLTTATFVPTTQLLVNRAYYFYAYGALDLTGNPATNNYTFFTTSYVSSATVPQVLNSNPENSVSGVAVNSTVQVLFNEPIQPETISHVQLLQGGTPVSATTDIGQGSTLVTLTPNALLQPNTLYTISATGVRDLAGHLQAVAYTSTFTTGPTIDLVHGTVTTFNPTNGETGVGTNAHVRIAFSKRINPLSLQFNNANIYEYNSGRYIPFTTTISTDRLSIALVPNVLLLPNNTYSVYSGGSIRDIAGNSVSASSVIFTTGAGQDTTGPTVSNLTPPNGATGVPVNTHVSALMSAPIDPTTFNSSAITVKQGTTVIPGTVTLSTDALTLLWIPSANLATSTSYTVQVSGISDQSGNPATASNTSFTTGSSGTVVGPGSLTLVSVTPTNGSVGVSNTAPVVITFSEAVDPTTVAMMAVYVNSPGAYVAGTWTVNPSNHAQATFTPAQPYPANANVTVYTFDRVRDYAGNTDSIGTVTAFTVTSVADTTHPTVTSISPLNNANSVGVNSPIVLTFSESMNFNTLALSSGYSVQLFANDKPLNYNYAVSSDNRTLTINGTGTLAPSTTYTVVASSSMLDLSGNSLTYFQSQFTTGPLISSTAPAVVTQRPGNGATGVPATALITLFVSGSALDPTTVNNGTVHVAQNGVLVAGTVSVTGNGQAIEFIPTTNFALGATVQIHLDTAIADVNAVPMSGAYTGSFTITADPATTAPSPVAYSPGYGSTAQPLNVIPQVQFNQALLASTINATNATLYDGNLGTTVAGTPTLVGANNNVVQFKPAANLTASHSYYLYLNNVKNTQNVALSNSYYNVFTTGTAADSATPTVTSVGPPNGTTGAGVNAAVILMFSKAINPISITGSTVSITGGSQTVVPASISFNSAMTEAIITPQAPLPSSTLMTVTINGVTDTQGHTVTPLTTTFTTAAGPVLSTPTVVQYSPIYNDTIATNGTFAAQFDRAMDPGTFFIDQTSVTLYDATLGTYMSGGTLSVSSDLKVISLKPPSALTTGHAIYFYVNNGRDLSGNPQSNFYTFANVGASADSAAPIVLETNPPANLTGVTPNVPIQIEFNEEMDPTSLVNLKLLQGSTPVAVAVSFTRLNHVIVLTPNVPLQASTVYTISINGVKDATGNTFSGTQLINFTTGSTIKVNAPSAVSITPCCSQINVPDNSAIQIVFDSPMDPLTFDAAVGGATLKLQSTSAIVPTTVSFSLDYKTVTLTPSAPLTSGTVYTITLDGSQLSDMAGYLLRPGRSESFTAK